jgi:hypothetical protein
VAVLRQERAQKHRFGHNAAVEAINNLLSLAKSMFHL